MIKYDYTESESVNQSRLKQIFIHPLNYLNYHDKKDDEGDEALHFKVGRMIDIALLENLEEAKSKFIPIDYPSPSVADKLVNLVDNSDRVLMLNLNKQTDRTIANYLLEQDVFSGNVKKVDKKIEHLEKFNMVSFFKSYIDGKCNRKTLLPKEAYDNALNVYEVMFNHPYSRKYFNPKYFPKGWERVTHLQLEFELYGFKCKAELDLVFFNDKFIKPIDLKTSDKPATYFERDFFKQRYDFQGAFYRQGLRECGYVEGRKLSKFEFVLAPLQNTLPHIFKIGHDTLDQAYNGNDPYYQSVLNAFIRLEHHTNTGDWDYPMEFNKGIKEILPR